MRVKSGTRKFKEKAFTGLYPSLQRTIDLIDSLLGNRNSNNESFLNIEKNSSISKLGSGNYNVYNVDDIVYLI